MNFDVDSGKLLYGLGVLFALLALAYFGQDLVFGLSITVKSALLFLAFVASFVAGVGIDRDVLDVVAFALSGLSYVAFVLYVLTSYSVDETGTFLIFAVSAALFLGLGFLVRERRPTVPARTAGLAVGGLALVGVVLVGADVAAGGVTYTADLNDQVTVAPPDGAPTDDEVTFVRGDVGTVTAENGPLFRRHLQDPGIRGCVVGMETPPGRGDVVELSLETDDRPRTIAGGGEVTFDVRVEFPVSTNESMPATLAVERADSCDAARADPTLLVVVEEGTRLE